MTSTEQKSEYDGKRVVIKLRSEEEPIEATVQAHTAQATMFKRKGKLNIDFEEAGNIESIKLAPEGETKIKKSRVDPVTLTNIKRHLTDRHGFPISQVENGVPEELVAWHNETLEHDDLSHFHAPKPTPAEKDAAKAKPAA